MSNSFFLTRQIANLLEDFVREIDRGSSLFILYGETGVGKSSILKKLAAQRLAHKTVHAVDFETEPQPVDNNRIVDICTNAEEAEVIIFDHFEAAPNKSQQQIFESWSTDGRDKHLNFIIGCSAADFNRCRQLAGQFQLQAMSFQLQPCSPEESEAYLRQLLYPDQPFGRLVIPKPVRRLLRQGRGLFEHIGKIAESHRGEIDIKQEPESHRQFMPYLIVTGLASVIFAAGYYIYLVQPPAVVEQVEVSRSLEERMTQAPIGSELESVIKPRAESEPVKNIPLEEETADTTRDETAIAETMGVQEVEQGRELDALQQRLEYSREWINNSRGDRGTIQVMSVDLTRFNNDRFGSLLDRLKQQGLDTDQLRLYKTRAGDSQIYGIVYGDFKDVKAAAQAMSLLPEELQAAKPIPRKISSIVSEIAKMDKRQ